VSVRELRKFNPIKHGGFIELLIDAFDKDVSRLSCCAGQQVKDNIGRLLGATASLTGLAAIARIYRIKKR